MDDNKQDNFKSNTPYNTEIITYGNNSVKVVHHLYEIKPKKAHSQNVDEYEIKQKIKENISLIQSVFGGKVSVLSEKRMKETASERAYRENINIRNSLAHTKKRINELSRSTTWTYFVTLTFAEDKIGDRTDYDLCMKKVKQWLNYQRKCSPELKYLCVPEAHKKQIDGKTTWHVHILMADIGTMKLEDSGRVAVGKKAYKKEGKYADGTYPTIWNLSGWHWGYSTAIEISGDVNRLANYVTKYVTKDLIIHTPNAHRYFASRNLEAPKIEKLMISDKVMDEALEDYLNRNNMEIRYAKTISNCYNPTTYYELREKGGESDA